jgi:hypothetical protein
MIPEQRPFTEGAEDDERNEPMSTDTGNIAELEPDTGPTQVKKWTVQDQDRIYEFDGSLIGFGSTETVVTDRWTEIEIYRTVGGSYIVHTVGVSLLYHDIDAECASGSVISVRRLYDSARKGDQHRPCGQCRPGPLSALIRQPDDRLRRESNRHSVKVVKNAGNLNEALQLKRATGEPYLSAVAREALREAVANDDGIRDALSVKIRIP